VGLAQFRAVAIGYPSLLILRVPHPFGSLSESELERIANTGAEELKRLLGLTA
jgi:hypothetical protein